jgi:glycyl-tRNA synthetase alpha chain
VTERQAYILKVRELAKGCCEAWLKTPGGGGLPDMQPLDA